MYERASMEETPTMLVLLLLLSFVLVALDGALVLQSLTWVSLPAAITEVFAHPAAFPAFLLLQAALFFCILWFGYMVPVRSLKRQIAFFITDGKKGNEFREEGSNGDIRFVSRFLASSLQILKKFKDEMKAGRVLRSEVEFAAEIQKHILRKRDFTIAGLDIVADSKSATEVGGDSYDALSVGRNHYIYLGDVTGHGVASGFVMMMVNSLVSAFAKSFVSGAEILSRTNEILKPRSKSNMLMTLLMLRYDEDTQKFYMTGAGHEYLLIYKQSTGQVIRIQSGGMALGMAKDISKALKETELEIAPGDMLILYTDGITEAKNASQSDGLLYGVDRLTQAITGAQYKTAQGVFNSVTSDLSRFMGYQHRQYDDITLLVIHYRSNLPVEHVAPKVVPNELLAEWNW